MPIDSAEPAPDRFRTFCTGIILRYRDHWPPAELVIAQEFISFMGNRLSADIISLRRCCEELGISVSTARPPHELRGCNSVFEDKRTIVLSEYQSWPGADSQTLLHELREVMEHGFREQGCPTSAGQELEKRAELFATLIMTGSVLESLPELIDSANRVSPKWLRWGAYLAIAAGAVVLIAAVALIPRFEDLQELEEEKRRSQRNPLG